MQTGVGRTGEFFAFQHDGVEPDLVATAKALSGGYVPVGATMASDWIFEKVYSSMDRVLVHDSTFGSNAQAMAAGLATLHVLEHEGVVENARKIGELLQSRLSELVERYEMLHEVRGRGLMIGIEFGRPTSWRLRAPWTALQAGPQGAVRADRGARAVPPPPHPDPGVRRPRRGDQADPAADHRRSRGGPVRRRVHRRHGRGAPAAPA